jgi:(S)-2-hydroxyglutarate dehydrogenase
MLNRIGVVGGGIIGLAIARKLQKKYPKAKVLLFEKEPELGRHQSGRNSGVLHCGLYYQPGSLKAQLAVKGIREMTRFCQTHEIPHEICGKIVVASNQREVKFLEDLAGRGNKNGLKGLQYLSSSELKAREPFVYAEKSLLVPEEGIVDYKAVMKKLAHLISTNNGEILCNTPITQVNEKGNEIRVYSASQEWHLDLLVNCTGLYSDRTFQAFTGNKRPLRIIPFRGEYLMLKPEAKNLVNHLVYPVPDPAFPFLGIHFTRMINGAREVGPNAVFAFKREGYTNAEFSLKDTLDAVSYKGFINFLLNNFQFSLGELKSSLSTAIFLKKAQKLIPDINASHFVKGTAGVRAQAMDASGKLLMDFNVIRHNNQVHVLNAPSPGATASLAIADYVINEYINS